MADLDHLRVEAARAWQRGAWAKAEKHLRQALRLRARDPELHRQLGLSLHRQGRSEDARTSLRMALQLAPEQAQVHMNLGSIEAAMGNVESALALLREACRLAPGSAAAWYNLGKTFKLDAREAEARSALERAIDLEPGHAAARTVLGDVLKALGETSAAENALRDALALQPASAHAWWSLANLKVAALSPLDLVAMSASIGKLDANSRSHAMLLFALAKGYEQHGQVEACFETLRNANAIMRRLLPWSREEFSAKVDVTMEAFAEARAPTVVDRGSSYAPIFIVGLPRTGSTLVEQILAAHPDVVAASELPDLPAVVDEESRRRGQPFPAWVAAADPEDWKRLADAYVARTARWREGRDDCRVTDKLPNNFLHVGAALAMFPEAHVIASDRDAMDTCWSCYQQYFAQGQAFSYDLDDLVDYYAAFRRLDRHWDQLFPSRYRRVRYEDLVADPDGAIPGILRFLGLPPHEACLHPHLARRSIRTASAAQVREPIDRRGEGRWRPFAALLAPWRDELRPYSED